MSRIGEKTVQITEEAIELPLATKEGGVLTGRGFICGKSGSGKSNTGGVLCEKILEQGLPLLIVDTEGEHYALKEKYEVLHVGADEEVDLQIGVEHADKIAELALEQNVPIVLDVSGYLDDETVYELIFEVLQALFEREKKLKQPFPVLIEEAHEYNPQKGSIENLTEMINRIGSRGRKRGLGIICLTQRPAKLDNDYISNADWRLWHWMDWPNDLDVVRKVLNKEWEQEVKDMDVGSAVMECPFADINIRKVRILRKETFDAGATPTLEDMDRPELKSVSDDLVEELQEISEQKRREEDRITQLEQEVEAKEQEIEELEEDLERAKDVSDMAEQFQQSLIATVNNTGDSDASEQIEQKIEELRDEKNQRIRELEKQTEQYEQRIAELEEQVEELDQYREYKDKFEDWEEKRDVVREALYRLRDELDIEVDGDVEKYKQRIQRQEQRIEELEQTLNRVEEQDGTSVKEERFEDAAAFLEDDLVAEYVERAADNTTYSEDHFWDALTVIAREGECTSGDIAPLVDLAKDSVSSVLSSLESNKVLVAERKGNSKAYSLNIDGIDDILDLKERREKIRQKSQQLKNAKNEEDSQ